MSPAFYIFPVVWIVLAIVLVIDVNKYSDEAFRATGSSRTTWIVWPIVGAVICGFVTLGFAIAWYSSKKAQVEAAASGGGGGYGQPPAGGGWQPPDQAPPPTA
jgi:hypothetical protein